MNVYKYEYIYNIVNWLPLNVILLFMDFKYSVDLNERRKKRAKVSDGEREW